jgi:hypothetical protein
LREGGTEEAKAAATQVLADFGYQNVPVTIDNDEWKFNADYLKAINKKDTASAERIADQYLSHMQERAAHFQLLAQSELERDVDHILLIHLNRINADHFDRLLDWYASEGWSFITVEEAMNDPVYSAPDLYVGHEVCPKSSASLDERANSCEGKAAIWQSAVPGSKSGGFDRLRNTLIFEQRWSVPNELPSPRVFQRQTEVGDMGSMAAWRFGELDWARV